MEENVDERSSNLENPQPTQKSKFKISYILIPLIIIALIIIISQCSGGGVEYTTKQLYYTGNFATAVVEVENKSNDYVSYTLDFQIHDRYGDLVGYQYMTIKLDPHMKKEFEIVALCSTSDLDGSKGEVRVY